MSTVLLNLKLNMTVVLTLLLNADRFVEISCHKLKDENETVVSLHYCMTFNVTIYSPTVMIRPGLAIARTRDYRINRLKNGTSREIRDGY